MADKSTPQLPRSPESRIPELESLLKLAGEKSQAGRNSLFATVQALFFDAKGTLSDRERALMSDILRQLVREVEISVRKDLAQRLADRGDAPRELVVALANDEIEVAHPILVHNTVLHDVDLIEIVRHRTQAHQLAVAMRKNITEDVSQALVDTGDTNVITTLLENGDAALSNSLMEYLVAESKRVDTFQNPLVNRRDLPPDLARKMYWWVSAAVRQHIVDNFSVDPAAIDDTIEGAVRDRIEDATMVAETPTEAEKVVHQIAGRGGLTEKFILGTLRDGEIALFEASFARAVDLRLKLARRLLYEPGGEALAMACRAVGFSAKTFATIFQSTRAANTANGPFDSRELGRLTDFFDCLRTTHAQAVVKRWRRDPEFLHAMNGMEAAS